MLIDGELISIVSQFESIGDNCEFGFVQRKLGSESEKRLLRWAFTPVDSLIAALGAEFDGLYEFENLKPASANMVCDERYNISFHSKIRSTFNDGKWTFVTPEDERKQIHGEEFQKLSYFRDKFLTATKSGGNKYVLKTNKGVRAEQINDVNRLIKDFGDNELLVVLPSQSNDDVGKVVLHESGAKIGYIDRFAPYNRADDV